MKTDLKSLKRYYIEIKQENKMPHKFYVRGYRVVFSSLPSVEFFICKTPQSKEWCIYDKKLGRRLVCGKEKDTARKVIKLGEEKLKEFGVEKFKRLYNHIQTTW
jgi:hypothetical protein